MGSDSATLEPQLPLSTTVGDISAGESEFGPFGAAMPSLDSISIQDISSQKDSLWESRAPLLEDAVYSASINAPENLPSEFIGDPYRVYRQTMVLTHGIFSSGAVHSLWGGLMSAECSPRARPPPCHTSSYLEPSTSFPMSGIFVSMRSKRVSREYNNLFLLPFVRGKGRETSSMQIVWRQGYDFAARTWV